MVQISALFLLALYTGKEVSGTNSLGQIHFNLQHVSSNQIPLCLKSVKTEELAFYSEIFTVETGEKNI